MKVSIHAGLNRGEWVSESQVRTLTPTLEISAPATLGAVRELRSRVVATAAEAGADAEVLDDIRLCVNEALTNVVAHAYPAEPGVVEIGVESGGDELTVVVSDEGKGLTEFRNDGSVGHGLRIIEKLARRYVISSAPNRGTEVRMVFPLDRD